MSEKEKKMERFKNHLMRIQEKIQNSVEDIQDQVQNKIERSKISKFISHLSSEERSSYDDNSEEKGDKISTDSIDNVKIECRNSIPSVVIDGPIDVDHDPKDTCKEFLHIERDNVLYKRRSLSATNLAYDDTNYHSSSDSCFSCVSSSDERYSF